MRKIEYLNPVVLTAWLAREADLRSDEEATVIDELIAQVRVEAERFGQEAGIEVEVLRGHNPHETG